MFRIAPFSADKFDSILALPVQRPILLGRRERPLGHRPLRRPMRSCQSLFAYLTYLKWLLHYTTLHTRVVSDLSLDTGLKLPRSPAKSDLPRIGIRNLGGKSLLDVKEACH